MLDQENLIKKFENIKKKSFAFLIDLGVKNENLEEDLKNLNIQVGSINPLKDFIWNQFHRHIERNARDFQKQYFIYLAMARFRKEFEEGKGVFELQKLAMQAFKNHNFATFDVDGFFIEAVISSNNKSCAVCRADDRRILNKQDFFNLDILPHENCTCKHGCSCCYGFRGVRDKDGKLIYRDIKQTENTRIPDSNMSIDFKREGAKSIMNLFSFFKKK